MTLQQPLKLIASLAAPLLAGAIAGYVTSAAIPNWYEQLNQPSFNPPNWLFGPVWTLLYVLMGYSCFLIWRLHPSRQRNIALGIYAVQLLLNFCWSFIFFYYKKMGIALIEISLLWIAIMVMIQGFRKLNPRAAYINIPYIFWVSFALILNAGYYFLNR